MISEKLLGIFALHQKEGGVLSPILFNFFINDLLEELNNNNITNLAYADDLAILITP